MLNFIIQTSLRHRLFVLAIAAGLMAFGMFQAGQLPIDVLPDLTRPRVVLITECPGLAPEEVESLVTVPLETAVNGATGVTSVRSSSDIGLSVIYADFDWGQDIYVARQIVNERIATVGNRLPPNIRPQLGPISSLLGQIMLVGMWSETGETSPMELRTLADWVVRQRLQRIEGVAQVFNMGGGRMQFQVLVDPHLLHKHSVSLHDVETALVEGNLNVSGGYLSDGPREVLLRGVGRVQTLDDIRSIVVANRPSRAVLIGDVAAEVKLGEAVKRGDAAINGTDGVVITIQKQPGRDTRALTEEVNAALEELRGGLPADVQLVTTYEQRDFIDYSVENVIEAVRDGAILVVIVLFLFLFNLRTTVITLTAIPLSIFTTALIFWWLDLTINVMTLGGLAVALGELVDDAIVDVENIYRRLNENRIAERPHSVIRVIFAASSEVRSAILMSTVMVVLVFAPIFALSGMAGRLFTPLGLAYVVSISCSTVVSLTVTPVLSYYLLTAARHTASRPDGFVIRHLKRVVRIVLNVALTPGGFFAFAALALGATVAAALSLSTMGVNFLPQFDEGAAQVNLYLKPGSSLATSLRVRKIADEKLSRLLVSKQNPDGLIRSFTAKTGRAEDDEHVMGVNVTEYVIALNPDNPLSREATLAQLQDSLAGVTGADKEVEQPIVHLISHMLSGVTAQIAVKLYGDDLSALLRSANTIKDDLAQIPGLKPPVVEPLQYIPQTRIYLKREQLASYGITPAYIYEMIETALNGRVVDHVIDGQRSFDMLVRFDEQFRADFASLDRTPIELPDGARVPLSELAVIQPATGPNTIKHEGGRRRIVVRINTRGRDQASAVRAIRDRLNTMQLPEGYYVELAGQFEEQQVATQRLLLFSLLAIAGVFVVLYATFDSTRLVLQVLVALPVAFVGGVLAIRITGQDLSVASMVGFISLGGIAVRNGILLIETYLRRVTTDGRSRETIVQGSLDRLAPVLMTALTTGVGLVPLVIGGQMPGKEILFPVATVVLGGLTTATLAEFLLRPGLFWYCSGDTLPQPTDGNDRQSPNESEW